MKKTLKSRESSGKVALIQLSSVVGASLLIRTCFFENIPQELILFLLEATYLKIGQGLEKDKRKLNESGIFLNGIIDIRNVSLKWPWLVANFPFCSGFGARSVYNFLFGGLFPIFEPSIDMLSPFYILENLELAQIYDCTCETQLALDLALFLTASAHNFSLPKNFCCHQDLGDLFLYILAPLAEREFIKFEGKEFRPKMDKALKTRCQKELNIKDYCHLAEGGKCGLCYSQITCWPLMKDPRFVKRQMILQPADFLPAQGAPFLAADFDKLLKLRNPIVLSIEDGLKITLEVNELDDKDFEGNSRNYAKFNWRNAPTLDDETLKTMLNSAKDIASDKVAFIRDKLAWKAGG